MTKQRPIKRYKNNFYVKKQGIKEQKKDQIQDSFMKDNKNIVSKHRWGLIVPLNKRGVILWNHLKENEKYIKFFKFDDINDEYEKIFDIVYETGNRDIMISSYESDVVELKYFAELREAMKKLNYTEKDVPHLLEAMKLAEESNTFLQWAM